MPQAKSILIIGAGVGGLSTAIYGRLNGYKTTIVEMHGRAGGVCTAWRRGGYLFDGCIHSLAGTSSSSPFQPMWRDLGVLPDQLMQAYPELVRVERPDGPPFVLYSDLERLQRHVHELFPADAPVFDELIADARRLTGLDVLGLAVARPLQRVKALAYVPLLMKYSMTLERYAERFKDPFLKSAFPKLIYDWPKQSMAMLLSFMTGAQKGDLGWPVGGSEALIDAMERRLRELGGAVRFDAEATKILVENDRAVGVRLTDGSELRADIVVSNAYGPATIEGMLGGRYTSNAIRRYYAHPQDRVEMGLHVSLGVARDMSTEPHAFVMPLDPPAVIAGETRDRLYVEPFGFDKSMAPAGKAALKVMLATSYKRWEDLRRMPELYRQEKQRVLETVIGLLERRYPGLKRQIEMVDVATPMTTLRYTGNGRGFEMPIERLAMGLFAGRRLSQTLPGLSHFYMAGQWAGLPGVPLVAAMGRDVIRAICRRDRRRFVTGPAATMTVPGRWPVERRAAA